MARDPVCDMSVEERSAPVTTTYGGKTYYFCSNDCFQRFNANPQKYIEQNVKKTVDA